MTDRKPPKLPVVEIKLPPPLHGARPVPPPDPRVDGAPAPPPRAKQQTTFPDLPSALPRALERTKVGAAGPPAPMSAPGAPGSDFTATIESAEPEPPVPAERPRRPPRIDSPAPVSQPTTAAEREAARLRAELQDARQEAARLREKQTEVEVEASPLSAARTALLRRLTPFLIGAVMSAVGAGVGYVRGLARGYVDAFERVAKLEGAFRTERDRRAKVEGATAELLGRHDEDLDGAFKVNRDQDSRLGKLDERVKALEGPIVVHPK